MVKFVHRMAHVNLNLKLDLVQAIKTALQVNIAMLMAIFAKLTAFQTMIVKMVKFVHLMDLVIPK